MTDVLTSDQIAEFKNAFDEFAKGTVIAVTGNFRDRAGLAVLLTTTVPRGAKAGHARSPMYVKEMTSKKKKLLQRLRLSE